MTYKKTTPGSKSDQDASGLVLVIQEYLPCLGKKMQVSKRTSWFLNIKFLFHRHPVFQDRLACKHCGYQGMNGPLPLASGEQRHRDHWRGGRAEDALPG